MTFAPGEPTVDGLAGDKGPVRGLGQGRECDFAPHWEGLRWLPRSSGGL